MTNAVVACACSPLEVALVVTPYPLCNQPLVLLWCLLANSMLTPLMCWLFTVACAGVGAVDVVQPLHLGLSATLLGL